MTRKDIQFIAICIRAAALVLIPAYLVWISEPVETDTALCSPKNKVRKRRCPPVFLGAAVDPEVPGACRPILAEIQFSVVAIAFLGYNFA
jgi:hypothetical protein